MERKSAEVQLEQYIGKHSKIVPAGDHYKHLKDCETLLLKVLKKLNEKGDECMKMETYLLLSKLHYISEMYPQALSDIEKSHSDSLSTKFETLRVLKLVAEGYSVKGLTLEKMCLKEHGKIDEATRTKCFDCFKFAAELGISYVTELEKSLFSHTRTSIPTDLSKRKDNIIGGIMESVLQKLPQFAMKGKDNASRWDIEGIEWYRKILTRMGDKYIGEKIMKKFSRFLAEILVKHRFERNTYGDSKTMDEKSQSLVFYSGPNHLHFCPNNNTEEILLLLFIAEALASKDVVLSRAEDCAARRESSLKNVTVVHSFITLILSSLGQYGVLCKVFERAMKFANNDSHIWLQFVLTLMSNGSYMRATKVLRQLIDTLESDENNKNNQTSMMKYLFLAKLELDSSMEVDHAIYASNKAFEAARGTWMEARASLVYAISYSSKLQTIMSFDERKKVLAKSIAMFDRSIDLDPKDDMAYFLSALNYANARDLEMAQKRCNQALELNAENPWNIMLLALLLTANKDFNGALSVITEALEEFPSNYGLLVLRLKLEMKCERVQEAMGTSKNLLQFWKNLQKPLFNSYGPYNPVGEENFSTKKSVYSVSNAGGTESVVKGNQRDNGYSFTPLLANSIGIISHQSHVSLNLGAYSEVLERQSVMPGVHQTCSSELGAMASTISESLGLKSMSTKSVDLMTAFRLQANLWVELAELFIDLNKIREVTSCVEEACSIFPNSHQALFLRGRLLNKRADECGDLEIEGKLISEAKSYYLAALSITPTHIPSLLHLSKIYKNQGNYEMTEKLLRDVINIDPLNHEHWNVLGTILLEQDRPIQALECFETSGALDKSTPLIQFSVIPKTLRCDT
uniref:TTC7_N domain-containing protein n=1 Tax=Rhabditophanes sp. KR3021 TaxID=114890 RepID=A0AC35TRV3_9BILA